MELDKDVEKLLESWELAEYIPVFAENKITLPILSLLDWDGISSLIKPVGHRVIFQKNLVQWVALTNTLEDRDNFVTKLRHPTVSEYDIIYGPSLKPDVPVHSTPTNTPDVQDVASNDQTSVEISFCTDLDLTSTEFDSPTTSASNSAVKGSFKYTGLKDLLLNSLEGQGLLNLYSESGLLSSNARRKICNIIVKHILEKNPLERISSSTLLHYAQEITTVFNKENVCTYFVPYLSNRKLKVRRLAKGKLYDCLQNRKREYREAFQSRSKENTEATLTTETSNQGPTEDNEDVTWLQNSCDPWETVVQKWSKTTEFRHRQIMKDSNSIDKYMKTYPALQKPTGFHLLVADFANQYPECVDNFKESFPLYKPKIIDLTVKKYSKHPDQGLKDLTEEYMKAINEGATTSDAVVEATSICALMFLPLLLGNPVGKNKKKCWRPSKQEARDSFLTHVKAEVDLKQTINTRREKYATLGLTFQPTIFIVGPSINNIKSYYIVVNDIFYVVNSIVEAVDVTFKLFHSLQCEYPTECHTVYSFLQKGFYKLSTKWDKEFTSVNALLADLDIK